MGKLTQRSAFLSLVFLLSACTYNPIVKIDPDVTIVPSSHSESSQGENEATIVDTSYSHTNWKSYIYYISAINGESIESSRKKTYMANYGLGRSMKIKLNEHHLPSGEVTLTIQGTTYIPIPMESFGNNDSVGGDVKIKLEAGKTYRVNGDLYDGDKEVWIEDINGKRLTQELTPTPRKKRYNNNLGLPRRR
ncbi:MAG: hypothetical protein HWE18_08545 [Gammaproteobacteria bacterium]|nr:hypothetical protein [Gammaproteobacteria bacterium]